MAKVITIYDPLGNTNVLTTVNADGPLNGGYVIQAGQPVGGLTNNSDYFIAVGGTAQRNKFTYKQSTDELHECI